MIPDIVVLALEYYRAPLSFPQLADVRQPLPAGMDELLASFRTLFAEDRIGQTAAALGATPDECRNAVRFFIKQVLFSPRADYYRLLGLDQDATHEDIKRHYRHLISIFHPDRDISDASWDDVHVPRLNEAYNTLRSADRRKAYDLGLRKAARPGAGGRRSSHHRLPMGGGKAGGKSHPSVSAGIRPVHLAIVMVVAFVAGLALTIMSSNRQTPRLKMTADPVAVENERDAASAADDVSEVREAEQETPAEADEETRPADAGRDMELQLLDEREIQRRVEEQVKRATRAIIGNASVTSQKPEPTRPADRPAPAQVTTPAPQAETRIQSGAAVERPPAQPVVQDPSTPMAVTPELFRLLASFMAEWQAGDVDRMLRLFKKEAMVSGDNGKVAAREYFTDLFAHRQTVDIGFDDFNWRHRFSHHITGEGIMRIEYRQPPGDRTWHDTGNIKLHVDASGDAPRIFAMSLTMNGNRKP